MACGGRICLGGKNSIHSPRGKRSLRAHAATSALPVLQHTNAGSHVPSRPGGVHRLHSGQRGRRLLQRQIHLVRVLGRQRRVLGRELGAPRNSVPALVRDVRHSVQGHGRLMPELGQEWRLQEQRGLHAEGVPHFLRPLLAEVHRPLGRLFRLDVGGRLRRQPGLHAQPLPSLVRRVPRRVHGHAQRLPRLG